MPETPQPTSNGIERTPTGEIAPPKPIAAESNPNMNPDPTPTPKPDPAADGKTLLTNKDGGPRPGEVKPAIPEKYDFKAPEAWKEKGWELDAKLLETATPIFKDLGLTQEQAQKLVDFCAGQSQSDHEATEALVIEQNKKWVDAAKAEFGPKLPTMKITISKAIDSLAPATATAFRNAMDESGQGNNPDFIRAFHAFAEMLTEGGHVAGRGPSQHGQNAKGQTRPSSPAQNMYPHLPSSQA